MDISNALIAKSDQLNAVDLAGGPRTVTITEVHKGPPDQPANVITDVFGPTRPFRPSKTVLRILAAAWGNETEAWVGKSMTLFRDTTVTWAGEEVGGIRIAAMSHIPKATTHVLPKSKGKFGKSTIQPLPTAAPQPTDTSGRDWVAELKLAGDDIDAVASLGKAATDAHAAGDVVAAIRARYTELKAGNA